MVLLKGNFKQLVLMTDDGNVSLVSKIHRTTIELYQDLPVCKFDQ